MCVKSKRLHLSLTSSSVLAQVLTYLSWCDGTEWCSGLSLSSHPDFTTYKLHCPDRFVNIVKPHLLLTETVPALCRYSEMT